MTTGQILLAAAFALGLFLSFFMSGMEAGVFALSRPRIRHFARRGLRRARVLQEYLDTPERFLWTILIGNTLATVMVAGIGVRWLHGWLAPRWVWLTLALILGVLAYYAACELLPKMLFRLYPNRLCMTLALPFRAIHSILAPVVGPVAFFSHAWLRWSGGQRFTGHVFGSRDELRSLMLESGQTFTTEERGMINRVLDLQNRTTAGLTTPWDKTVTFAADTTVAEALVQAREVGYTRIPVWRPEAGRRRIAGVLDLSALLYDEKIDPARRVGDLLQPALFLDDGTRLEIALHQLQRTGRRLAIVIGRNGEEVGIITLQDILRVIFGGGPDSAAPGLPNPAAS